MTTDLHRLSVNICENLWLFSFNLPYDSKTILHNFIRIFYVLRKNSNTTKAIELIRKLREIVEIGVATEFSIDCALSAGWNDFEDAIQYFCALENNCEAITTRNSSDYQDAEIGIFEPAHFIEISGL